MRAPHRRVGIKHHPQLVRPWIGRKMEAEPKQRDGEHLGPVAQERPAGRKKSNSA